MEDFWTQAQKENITFFNKSLENLLADPLYKNKFVIIFEKRIEGFFDTFDAALNEAVTRFLPGGEYIIQQIIQQKETVNFLYPALAPA